MDKGERHLIDEWFERWVDWLCDAVPRRVKPWLLRLSGTSPGWRLCLYASGLWGRIAAAFSSISSEESVDSLIDEMMNRDGGTGQISLRAAISARLLRAQAGLLRARFAALFYLLALSALGVLAAGGSLSGGCCAAVALYWLAEGMERGYAPVSGAVRQHYLWAVALRALGDGALLLAFFRSYAAESLPLNIVLQSAMIVALLIHAVLFLSLIAFNRNQPLLLRALWGVLGTLPALCAAAAVAMAASRMAAPPPALAAAIGAALGAVLLFFSQELLAMERLGAIRLRYGALWQGMMMLTGLALVLAGAWGAPA